MKGECHILNVAIKPGLQQRGYGTHLMTEFFKTMKEITPQEIKYLLEVRKSNEQAIKLYTKFKFSIVGTRKKYYTDGEDAILMTLMQ